MITEFEVVQTINWIEYIYLSKFVHILFCENQGL